MASKTLYPPIVDSYMPAFVVGERDYCRIYFSLSKFNGSADFKSVHVSVVKQDTGMSVVDSSKDLHRTGIILNLIGNQVVNNSNLYYVDIYNSDLSSIVGSYKGWVPGWVYKIQLRLCDADNYNPDSGMGEANWLKSNAEKFSEWSTICVIKAIGKIDYNLISLGINTEDLDTSISSLQGQNISSAFLDLTGSFSNKIDPSELIYSYNFTLFDIDGNIIEESGDIYSSQFQDNNTIHYLMKTELRTGKEYKLAFKFTTINNYEGGFFKVDEEDDIDERFTFTCTVNETNIAPCVLATIENNSTGAITDEITTKVLEEDEGRVAIKFYSSTSDIWSGNLCIRRSSSKDNFSTWEDVFIYVCKQENINDIPVYYDYTIESGIWYKYGVQIIIPNGDRGKLEQISNPIMRNFNYSFILGKNNQQLKLQFDNSMNSFKHQVSESKIDPIGSKYTDISRNAMTYYKTFPVNGLISFWMDENELFASKLDIYKYENIVELYNTYNTNEGIIQYDYIYERQFRDAVLEFLYDGEYKLFKSPTEGNIIVRLTDINCTPNQSIGRMIYSFSANTYEMDEPTMANYLKYGLAKVGKYDTSFAISSTRLGQIQMNIPTNRTTDIIAEIVKKYDSGNQNIGGYSRKVASIHHIKISFDGKPVRFEVGSNGTTTLYDVGYHLSVNNQEFKIFSPVDVFEFDERLVYSPSDKIYILGDADGLVTTMPITVDFLYEMISDTYIIKQIQTQQTIRGVAQIYEECIPRTNLFKEIQYKYRIELKNRFKKMLGLSSIEIEANPGAAFGIKDSFDAKEEIHVVGDTGVLRLYELENIISLKYLGMQNPETGIIENKNTDVLMNYFYLAQQGTYKE